MIIHFSLLCQTSWWASRNISNVIYRIISQCSFPIAICIGFVNFFRNTVVPTRSGTSEFLFESIEKFALKFWLKFVIGCSIAVGLEFAVWLNLEKLTATDLYETEFGMLLQFLAKLLIKNLSWISGSNCSIGHSSMIIWTALSVVWVMKAGIFETGTVYTFATVTVFNIRSVLNYARIDRVWIFRTGTVGSYDIKAFINWCNSGAVRTAIVVCHYLSKKIS